MLEETGLTHDLLVSASAIRFRRLEKLVLVTCPLTRLLAGLESLGAPVVLRNVKPIDAILNVCFWKMSFSRRGFEGQ